MRKFFIGALLCAGGVQLPAQTTLYIPDTLSGTAFTLNLHRDSVQFYPGTITQTNGFNSHKYLGPTLILKKGDNINMTVNNQLADSTAIHWHGLHVASTNDGGPHTPIIPGGTWNPVFKVMNWAAMYWYHPHLHKKTGMQAMRGAAGLIIVRDSAEATLNLPRRYGMDDFPVIVQSQQFDSVNRINYKGMQDSIILVNGSRANYGYSVYGNFPAQVVRMRLLNGSQERTYSFGFTANKQFYVIGNDGGLLQAPVSTTRIWLSPGERAEILLDLTGMNGQTLYLMNYGSDLPMGVQGGPTMPMGGSGPPMDSPLNGADFNLLKINVVAQTSNPVTTIPSALIADTPLQASQANVTRPINFTAVSMMSMDGPFFFNDSTFNMMRIDYHIPLNNVEIWQLSNQTMVAHPFHIHDVNFYILDRDGNAPAAVEKGKKDVVLVQPNETVRFITKFTDFVDSIVPYMYHCHILMHEDDGMMGQFVVMPQGWSGIGPLESVSKDFSLYPNPSQEIVTINLEGFTKGEPVEIIIYDCIGKSVYHTTQKEASCKIITSGWNKGLYSVSLLQGNVKMHRKLIVD